MLPFSNKPSVGRNNRILWLFGLLIGICPEQVYARKTVQPLYEEPFDLAAGGASLTRASLEGVLFANPALMPYGGKFHRWFGSQFSLWGNREIQSLLKASTKSSEAASAEGESSSDSGNDVVSKLFSTPFNAGVATALSYINSNFGLGIITKVSQDLEAKEYGATGLPTVTLEGEVYAGAVMSLATKVTRWFSLGVTAKYLYVSEPYTSFDLSQAEQISAMMNDPNEIRKQFEPQPGMGADVGMLFFFQGSTTDFRLAAKVDDVGDTQFGSDGVRFKQTVSGGLGLTFHGDVEALHLAVDYRDILNAYDEKPFKRIYTGAKLVIREMIGFAAGYYQGIPSAGVRLDLWLLHVGVTAYGRELGHYIGEKQRNLYVAYFGMGF